MKNNMVSTLQHDINVIKLYGYKNNMSIFVL